VRACVIRGLGARFTFVGMVSEGARTL
jgi:hypothetical protein